MKNLRLPGFPPPEKQDTIRFHLLKSLSYSTRMFLYLLFIAIGFLFQVITLTAWPGALFIVVAVLLNLVRGYDSKVNLDAFSAGSNWTQVDMQKIREVEEFNAKLTKWDKDALDISNGTGFLMFVLAGLGLLFASVLLRALSVGDAIRAIFMTDAIILVLSIWFNGLRQIRKQDLLIVKTNLVGQLDAFFQTIQREGEHLKPALMLAKDKTGKSVPTDCRFTVAFDGMPADFYGIQAQINMNSVQSAYYPYFYCVIAAKRGFGLERYVQMVPVPKSIIMNFEIDDASNAEVIVIRQYTTKTSGYHTKINSCKSILERAVTVARMVLDNSRRQA